MQQHADVGDKSQALPTLKILLAQNIQSSMPKSLKKRNKHKA